MKGERRRAFVRAGRYDFRSQAAGERAAVRGAEGYIVIRHRSSATRQRRRARRHGKPLRYAGGAVGSSSDGEIGEKWPQNVIFGDIKGLMSNGINEWRET